MHERDRVNRFSKLSQIQTHNKVRCRWREDVTAVKGMRDGLNVVVLVRQLDDIQDPAQSLGGGRQKAVVRTDEDGSVGGSYGQGTTLGADARVYDGQVHYIFWHVVRGVLKYLRTRTHPETGDFMCEVYDHCPWRDAEHHAFAQPDKVVAEPKIREKADRSHTLQYRAQRPTIV